MNETERVAQLKSRLVSAVVLTTDAEIHLENAADLAELTPDKAEEIWALKTELNRLGVRIMEASKV